jgi:hypothetical protein
VVGKIEEKDLWVSKKGFYMLWFEFLADSPSYELARRYRTKSLSPQDKQQLPADFDQVLSVYDDFGDVQRQQFTQWWDETGMQICAFRSRKPRVTRVAALPRRLTDVNKVKSNVENYITRGWRNQGRQNTLLLALPIGLTKANIAKQISTILGKYPEAVKQINPRPPKYALQGKRQNKDMLFRYMHVLRARAALPNLTLWRIGARTGVSDTYSPVLDYKEKVLCKGDTYDRTMLTIITSRAFLRGKLIAENAARGVFPSYSACPHAIAPDLSESHKRFLSRRKWLKALANDI